MQLFAALFFVVLGFMIHALAAERATPRELEEIRLDVAAVKDSVLLLAQASELSSEVRERILEDIGVLRSQAYWEFWRQRYEAVSRVGRSDTVHIGAVLLEGLLQYYRQWGDLRGVITLTSSAESVPRLQLPFSSITEGRKLVGFIGRYRGPMSLNKVEFLPLSQSLQTGSGSFPAALGAMSSFFLNCYAEKSTVGVEVALSPSFEED